MFGRLTARKERPRLGEMLVYFLREGTAAPLRQARGKRALRFLEFAHVFAMNLRHRAPLRTANLRDDLLQVSRVLPPARLGQFHLARRTMAVTFDKLVEARSVLGDSKKQRVLFVRGVIFERHRQSACKTRALCFAHELHEQRFECIQRDASEERGLERLLAKRIQHPLAAVAYSFTTSGVVRRVRFSARCSRTYSSTAAGLPDRRPPSQSSSSVADSATIGAPIGSHRAT